MALIDELLVGLGFEYDPKEMKQFKDDVGKTVDIVKSLTKVAIAGAAAITAMVTASTAASDEQGKLAAEIGDTVDNIDALQFASKRAGGTADGMSSSLRNLAIRASEASRGMGSGVEAFGLLGISVTDLNGKLKPTSDLLTEISKEFEGLDSAKQIELADKLGVRDSIRLLQQGKASIADLVNEARLLGVTTKEDAATAAEFQDSLTDLWQITKQITRTLTKVFAPAMIKLNKQFTEWWEMNRAIIEQKLPEWIDKFTLAFKLLTVAVAAFLAFRLATHLVTLVALLKGLTLATLGAGAAAFLLPALIAAVATAFVALVEDAKVFFEGGESTIGDMIKKFPEWTSEINVAASALATVAELTGMIFDGWSGIINLFKDFSIEGLGEVFSNLPGFLGDATGLVNAGGGGVIPELGQSISNTASTVVDKLEIVVQGGADTAENIANAVLNVFEQASQDLQSAVDL